MAEPTVDLRYSIHDYPADSRPDSKFLFRRIEEAMAEEGLALGGRTLDVACGAGNLAAAVHARGGEAWGMDPSAEMLGIGRYLFSEDQVTLLRGIAEALPFRPGSFDRIVCQGSLDHFVDPRAFMAEAAKVLSPDGRLIIALCNYDSVSCHVGRFRQWLGRDLLKRPRSQDRGYWDMPPDHYHRGEPSFIRGLGGPSLELERFYGISLLWPVYGWEKVLERLPRSFTRGLLTTLDQIAYGAPAMADMIVSVWRRKEPGTAHGNNHP